MAAASQGIDRTPNSRTIVSSEMITESEIERRKGRRALIVLLGFVLLVPLAIGVGSYHLLKGSSRQVAPALPALRAIPAVRPRAAALPTIPPRADLPPLDASDAFLRKLAAGLSSNPGWSKWLLTDRLAQRFVASVDNVAEGRSPQAHLGVLAPSGEFKVHEHGDAATVDPASYRRYDAVAGVIASLDVKGLCTALPGDPAALRRRVQGAWLSRSQLRRRVGKGDPAALGDTRAPWRRCAPSGREELEARGSRARKFDTGPETSAAHGSGEREEDQAKAPRPRRGAESLRVSDLVSAPRIG